mgnify:CR=1 FL=1
MMPPVILMCALPFDSARSDLAAVTSSVNSSVPSMGMPAMPSQAPSMGNAPSEIELASVATASWSGAMWNVPLAWPLARCALYAPSAWLRRRANNPLFTVRSSIFSTLGFSPGRCISRRTLPPVTPGPPSSERPNSSIVTRPPSAVPAIASTRSLIRSRGRA